MIEALVTGVISLLVGVCGGAAASISRTTYRIDQVDRRIDDIELRLAEKYVPRQELAKALEKMEDHMVRIENKLDQIVLRNGN